MKKKIAVLAIMALVLGTSAFAAGYTISATLRPDIKVVVDGVTQEFKDATGEIVSPISYNNTTYLPIRAIGALMEKSVDWDGSTQTIYLGGKPNNMSHQEISSKLDEINNWVIGDLWNDGYVNIRGYVNSGNDSLGQVMTEADMDALLAKLDKDMERKAGYSDFIKALSDVGYADVKSTWNTLMTESDVLYNKVKSEKPIEKNGSYKFETDDFVTARTAFDDAIGKVS